MIDKAEQTWQEACLLCDSGRLNGAANRYYYAVFQAVYGFALQKGLIDKERKDGLHKEAGDVVRRHNRRLWPSFRLLHSMRIRADYKTENIAESEMTRHLLDRARDIKDYFHRQNQG